MSEEHFIKQNAFSPKNGKGSAVGLKMHMFVGWCVKLNSL